MVANGSFVGFFVVFLLLESTTVLMCVVSLLNADEHPLYPCALGVFAISWSVAENAVQYQALQRGSRALEELLCSDG